MMMDMDRPIPILPEAFDPNVEWYHCVVDRQGLLAYHGYMQALNYAAVMYLDEICHGGIDLRGVRTFMSRQLHTTALAAALEENTACGISMEVPVIKRPIRFLYAYRTQVEL